MTRLLTASLIALLLAVPVATQKRFRTVAVPPADPPSEEQGAPTGDGASTQWSLSAGTDHFALVDDPIGTPDGDATYILKSGSGNNQNDLFTFTAFDLPTQSTVTSVTVHIVARRVAGNVSHAAIVSVDGTTYASADSASETSEYEEYIHTFTTNPATGLAWCEQDIEGTGPNPLEAFGVRSRSQDANDENRVTALYLTIEYVDDGQGAPCDGGGGGPGGGEPCGQAGSLIESATHPRLFLTGATIPTIRAKLQSGAAQATAYQQFVARLDGIYGTGSTFTLNTTYTTTMDVLNMAFIWMMRDDGSDGTSLSHHPSSITSQTDITPAQYRDEAIEKLLEIGDNGSNNNLDLHGHTTAVIYDWLYDQLTAPQRATVASTLAAFAIARGDHTPAPPFDDAEQLAKSRGAMIGLALMNDNIDATTDANASTLCAKVAAGLLYGTDASTTTFADGGIEGANWYAGTTGGHFSGKDYFDKGANNGTRNWIVWAEAYRTAENLDFTAFYDTDDNLAYIRYWIYWWTYGLAPDRKSGNTSGPPFLNRIARSFRMTQTFGAGARPKHFAAITSGLFRTIDPDAAALADWYLMAINGQDAEGNNNEESIWSKFIFGRDATIAPQDPEQLGLPLAYCTDPGGYCTTRSRWMDPTQTADGNGMRTRLDPLSSFVTFFASKWNRRSGGDMERHSGTWTYDRRGPLIVYAGPSTHYSWANGSDPGNTVVFPNPSESATVTDDYGQRYSGLQAFNSAVQRAVDDGDWDMLGETRTEIGSASLDVDYFYRDLSRAYKGGQITVGSGPSLVKRFTRQLAYFRRPAHTASSRDVIGICDRIETESAVASTNEKRWMIHFAREPTVSGTGTAGQPVRGTEHSVVPVGSNTYIYTGGGGKTRYVSHTANAATIDVTNNTQGSSGRAWITVGLPSNPVIVKGGGPNLDGEYAWPRNSCAISALARNGSGSATATTSSACITNLGLSGISGSSPQKHVIIFGASPSDYNGLHRVTSSTATTFTFALAGSADSATGTVRFNRPPSYEFEDVYGRLLADNQINYDTTGGVNDLSQYVGQWRAEVIPSTLQAVDQFLVVLEGADATESSKSTTAYLTGTNYVAMRSGTRIFACGAQASVSYASPTWVESRLTTGSLVLPDETATFTVLFTDLPNSASRTLTKGASLGTVSCQGDTDLTVTTSASGTLYCSVSVTSGGNAASRTLTIGS